MTDKTVPARTEHVPSGEWGGDTFVQWGESGIVLDTRDPSKSYGTAFFEAFPKTGAGFIRGEGATVAEAEEDALAQRRRELSCEDHLWCRRGYTNGVATCSRCGIMDNKALPAIVRLGDWRKPPTVHAVKRLLEPGYVRLEIGLGQYAVRTPSADRRRVLRLRRLGLALPDRGEEDLRVHAEACVQAARAWARGLDEAGVARLRRPAVLASGGGLLGPDREREGLLDLIRVLREPAAPGGADG